MANVFLAFSKEDTANKIRRMLSGSQYRVAGICHTADELLRSIYSVDDAAVIMSYALPDSNLFELYPKLDCPAVVLIRDEDMELFEGLEGGNALYTLPLPIDRSKLIAAADICFGPVIRRRAASARSDEDNDIIERAKRKLMESGNMTEAQAYRFIQKRSMDTGSKLADTARMILYP